MTSNTSCRTLDACMLPTLLSFVVALATVGTFPSSVLAGASGSPPTSADSRMQELELEQAKLRKRMTEQLDQMDDGPRREELRRLLAEIDRRTTDSRKLYLAPSARMTEEMKTYHARLIRKIEDCGTRNFPKENGKSIYGKGLMAVTLDRAGRAVETEILESSGRKALNSHMARIVRASSPFGPIPKRVRAEGEGPFELLVVLTRFDFTHDDGPTGDLDEKERCRWR